MEIVLVLIVLVIVFLILASKKKTPKNIETELLSSKPTQAVKSEPIESQADEIEESDTEYLNSFVVIDTETTGLSEGYQVIEIAIVDID